MEITTNNSTRMMETIFNMIIKVHLEDFQEGKFMQQINFLHYQEDLHLHHLEMKIALDSQTTLIGTNAVLSVHHLIKTEINLDVVN